LNTKPNQVNKYLHLHGTPASPGSSTRPAIVIPLGSKQPFSIHSSSFTSSNFILILEAGSPDFIPIISDSSGVITERGGKTAHAAEVCRRLGIPCIVNVSGILGLVKPGMVVEMNGETGEIVVELGYWESKVEA